MSKYKIWNGTDEVVTPIGEVLTPAQWVQKYPIAARATTVVADGDVNGAFFGILSQMKKMASDGGADFSEATTDEEVLQVIEAWEESLNPAPDDTTPDQTRMADALEDLVVLTELSQS